MSFSYFMRLSTLPPRKIKSRPARNSSAIPLPIQSINWDRSHSFTNANGVESTSPGYPRCQGGHPKENVNARGFVEAVRDVVDNFWSNGRTGKPPPRFRTECSQYS